MALCVREEVILFASVPSAPWLQQLETLASLRGVLHELLSVSTFDELGRNFVTPQAISAALDITPVQTKVLVDLLAAVVDPPELVQRSDGGDEVVAVEAYSLALLLFAHYYLREAHKADSSDVWPAELFSMQAEPSSPMRMTAHSWGREQQGGHAHKAYLPSMRQHLQQHLQLQEALLSGFSGFLGRNAEALVALVASPSASPGKAGSIGGSSQPHGMISAAEVDRLGFLLRPPSPDEGDVSEGQAASPTPGPSSSSGGGGGGVGGGAVVGRRKRRLVAEGGSPMDVCPTPFTEDGVRLSEHTPFFSPDAPTAYAPADAFVAWLGDTLRPADEGTDLMVTSGGPGSPRAPPSPSQSRQSVFNQLATQLGVLGPQPAPGDVHGVHKATVARGEEEFPSARVRILDCHDAVVYCLAPLQYALITACSDCTVVLGAVGRALRVERCERVQVIAATRSLAINTCHDCIFYLGVNSPPLLLGDNRFLQLAPYNSGYERLPAHMSMAGVKALPNQWDQPLALLPDHTKHHHAALHGGQEPSSPMQAWQAAALQREQQAADAAGGGGPLSPRSFQQQQQQAQPMELSQQSQPGQQQQQEQQMQQQQQGPQLAAEGGSPSAMSLTTGGVAPVTPASPSGSAGSPGAGGHLTEEGLPASPVLGAPAAVSVLPPAKLMPFVVPFKGGSGPLCGGPASISLGIRASSSAGSSPTAASPSSSDTLSNFMAAGEGASGSFPASPFALPAAYAAAWQAKMQGASEVRAAVKAADLEEGKKRELMTAIQAHFKDWLQATGAMRQVYDLARAERDAEGGSSGGSAGAAGGGGGGSGGAGSSGMG